MKYPKEYLDEIKTRLKVSSVVSKTVNLKKRGKEFVGLSPFKTEKTPSFTVNDEKGFYHCFSTSEHGNIFDFVMKTQNLKFGETVKFLANLAGMQPYTFSKQDLEREKIVLDTLREVKLEPPVEIANKYPHMLSGGQRQRVVLARALVLRPKIIIADEPVSMLDVSIRAEILDLMKNIQKKNNISFIYITHDLATARYFGQRIIILYLGKIMEFGSIERVLLEPRHPYTQALIDAISEPDPDNLCREKTIRINDPLDIDFYSGCRFLARCPYAIKKCKNVPMLETRDGRNVACFVDINKLI